MSARVVLGLVRDLFFRSKLDAVAESAGVNLYYASDLNAAARHCLDKHPELVLVDLSDAAFPAAATAARLHAELPDSPIVGFASHLDLKPLRAARDAGFALALSRSEFTARLPELLKEGLGVRKNPL
jgi:DNA-binding NarL/FixJ family response regulator